MRIKAKVKVQHLSVEGLILWFLMFSINVHAYDVEYDGIFYNIDDNTKTAEVTYKEQYKETVNYSGTIKIPESITIGDKRYNVTSIGTEAFRYCRSIYSVSLPNSITTIGKSAFERCETLSSITIPKSVVVIGGNAFSGCKSITSVTIPNSVTSIGQNPFSECPFVTSINVDKDNPKYDSRDNCNAIIETATNSLITGCYKTVIPYGIIKIDACAFYHCENLISINLPNSITTIESLAFFGCEKLQSVIIPNSVLKIGGTMGSFEACTNLSSVKVEEDNPMYDSRDNCNAIIETSTNKLIVGGISTVIPNSVTIIGKNAFYGSGINSVFLPNSVRSIEAMSFAYCFNLKTITIPSDVKSIDYETFWLCYNLSLVNSKIISPFDIGNNAFGSISSNAKLVVPKGTKNSYMSYDEWVKNFTDIVEDEETATLYSLNIKAIGNGSALYNETTVRDKTSSFTVNEGSSVTIMFSPDDGNKIKSVKVNNSDVTSGVSNNQYTISSITGDTNVEVEFEAETTLQSNIEQTLSFDFHCYADEKEEANTDYWSVDIFKEDLTSIYFNMSEESFSEKYVFDAGSDNIGYQFRKDGDSFTRITTASDLIGVMREFLPGTYNNETFYKSDIRWTLGASDLQKIYRDLDARGKLDRSGSDIVNTEPISTWVRYKQRNAAEDAPAIYLQFVIPARYIHFAKGRISGGKILSSWYQLNSSSLAEGYYNAKEVHVSVPSPTSDIRTELLGGYNCVDMPSNPERLSIQYDDLLERTEFLTNLHDYFTNGELSAIVADFSHFPQLSSMEIIPAFEFIVPSATIGNASFSANDQGQWKVKGISGAEYTLALANDNKEIRIVKKGYASLSPNPVLACINKDYDNDIQSVIKLHQGQFQDDILNYRGHDDLGELETFTAYLRIFAPRANVPLEFDDAWFNARFLRPVNLENPNGFRKENDSNWQYVDLAQAANVTDWRGYQGKINGSNQNGTFDLAYYQIEFDADEANTLTDANLAASVRQPVSGNLGDNLNDVLDINTTTDANYSVQRLSKSYQVQGLNIEKVLDYNGTPCPDNMKSSLIRFKNNSNLTDDFRLFVPVNMTYVFGQDIENAQQKYITVELKQPAQQVSYTLSIQATGNGSAFYNGTTIRGYMSSFTVNEGMSATIYFSPDNGYRIKSVKENNTNVTSYVSNNTYTISSINRDTNIEVEFEADSRAIIEAGTPDVDYNTATIPVKVSSDSDIEVSSYGIKYSTHADMSDALIVIGTGKLSANTFSNVMIEGLQPGTTYYYQAFANLTTPAMSLETEVASFTTLTKELTVTAEVSYKTTTTATLDLGFKGNVRGTIYYKVLYGQDKNLVEDTEATRKKQGTWELTTAGTTQYASVELTDLEPGKTYYYRVRAQYVDFEATPVSGSFETDSQETPAKTLKITSVSASNITTNTATISIQVVANSVENVSYKVNYSKNADLSDAQEKRGNVQLETTNGETISVGIDQLEEQTTYYYKVSVYYTTDTSISDTKSGIFETAESIKAFSMDGVNYTVESLSNKTVVVASGNYGQVLTVPASVTANGYTWTVVGIETDALSGNKELTAVIWNPYATFNAKVSNPNLLLYVKDEQYATSSIQNVVVNGNAKKIVLAEASSGNNFYCPQAFTAQQISYTHNYQMQTGIGESKGWETIALPFDVQTFTHETKGSIVPFAQWKSGDAAKPFWLYELTGTGFVETGSLKAYTPYIISMPNNPQYDSQWLLNGKVTFAASGVTVGKTENLNQSTFQDRTFIPCFAEKESASGVYALNVNNDFETNNSGMTEGSKFVLNMRHVHPFEAYMISSSSAAQYAFGVFEGMTTSIENFEHSTLNIEYYYDLQGRKVETPSKKGVYIVNGKKIIK